MLELHRFKISLIVSDLDGTLLGKEGRLSERSRKILTPLLEENLPLTVATGRAFSSFRHGIAPLNLRLPVISSNGAWISLPEDPRPIHAFDIGPQLAEDFLAFLQERGAPFYLDHWDTQQNYNLLCRDSNPGLDFLIRFKSLEPLSYFLVVDDFRPYLSHTLISFTISLPTPELQALQSEIEERFAGQLRVEAYHYRDLPGWSVIWVQSELARKEIALLKLAELLGHHPEEILAFGDELNDQGLFEGPFQCLAVENAHPIIQTLAQGIIGHHQDDAVATTIQAWFQSSI
jgi:hydroxymethylpyrimidine pyrophosphatase-like HAD family hydrolase